MNKKVIDKEAIIAEYLTGGISYRELGNKYGIGYKMINLWVMKYQGKERTPREFCGVPHSNDPLGESQLLK